MANIQYLPNQAIQFYKVDPSEDEIADGNTPWASTAYHKRNGQCDFIGPDYCHPVLDTDKLAFQFKAATNGDEMIQGRFSTPEESGTNTSVTANKLVDSGADFSALSLNQLVLNQTDNTSAYIDGLDSSTVLTLSENIFTATPKTYQIFNINISGDWGYDAIDGIMSIGVAGSGGIEFPGLLTIDNWYKFTVTITDITAGSLQIKLGTNTIATLTSVGTHTVFGKCLSATDLSIVNSASFIGSINTVSLALYELQTNYTIAVFDLDENFITSIVHTEDSDSLTIGNVLVNMDWGTFGLECGAYVLGIYEGDIAPCSGQMVTNGGFASSTGWTTGTNITIIDGKAEFNAAPEFATLQNELFCCLKSGNSYTLTYDVGTVDTLKQGSYRITQIPGTPSYNAALQTSVSVTFTAEDDSCTLAFVCVNECTFSLDNVSLVCNDCVLIEDDADGLSECYCVCDSHDCTILLKYRNDDNAFGMYYEDDSYYNYLRLDASILSAPIKDNQLIQFKNTLHLMNLPYWDGIKVFQLATGLLPAWVHNAISLALKHRILLGDGVRYIGIEEHTYNEELTEVFGATTRIAQYNQKYLNNIY